jgi:hypothetical protein
MVKLCLSSPEKLEALAMPFDYGVGFNQKQSRAPTLPEPRKGSLE